MTGVPKNLQDIRLGHADRGFVGKILRLDAPLNGLSLPPLGAPGGSPQMPGLTLPPLNGLPGQPAAPAPTKPAAPPATDLSQPPKIN